MAALTGTIVAVLFIAVATAGSVEYADGTGSFATEPASAPVPTMPPATELPVESGTRTPWELPQFVETILRVVFYGAVAAFVALILVYAWRHRPTFHWTPRRRRPTTSEFDALDEVAAAISADAGAQHAALRRGSPRNAIVECWLRLEAAVEAAGVPRQPADTSTELIQRVLTNRQVEATAIAELAALYREARFSDHAMTEDARTAAIELLDTVHAGLRSDREQPVATA